MIMKRQKEFLMIHHLAPPRRPVNLLQLVKPLPRKVQSLPIDIVEVRSPADRRLLTQRTAPNPIDDPLENTHVFAISRPQKLTVFSLAKPIYMKDPGRSREITLHPQPMPEVVPHVIATEGQHSHWVAPNLPKGTSRGSRRLRAHRSPCIDPSRPIKRLINQWHSSAAAPAEDDRRDRYAIGSLPVGIDGGTLAGRSSEASIRMSSRFAALLADLVRPAFPAPIEALGGWPIGHALPPDTALRGKSDVGEDGVTGQCRHGVGIGLR